MQRDYRCILKKYESNDNFIRKTADEDALQCDATYLMYDFTCFASNRNSPKFTSKFIKIHKNSHQNSYKNSYRNAQNLYNIIYESYTINMNRTYKYQSVCRLNNTTRVCY